MVSRRKGTTMFSGTGLSVHRVFLRLFVLGLPLLPTSIVARSEALPPEPPRVFLDTTLVAPSGRTIAVPAGGDFQGALNAALPGDVIESASRLNR